MSTPGPWGFVYDGSSDWSIGPADDPQGHRVATCWVPHYRETHTIVAGVPVADVPADVCLIAAAPELLDALRVMCGIYRELAGRVGERLALPQLEVADEAIAKAEGKA